MDAAAIYNLRTWVDDFFFFISGSLFFSTVAGTQGLMHARQHSTSELHPQPSSFKIQF